MAMETSFTQYNLRQENQVFRGTGGISQGNRQFCFEPAFCDWETGTVYPSCYEDGSPASCHMLDGLPSDVVTAQDNDGHITAVKPTIVSGFLRAGRFYTREEAARAVARPTLLKPFKRLRKSHKDSNHRKSCQL